MIFSREAQLEDQFEESDTDELMVEEPENTDKADTENEEHVDDAETISEDEQSEDQKSAKSNDSFEEYLSNNFDSKNESKLDELENYIKLPREKLNVNPLMWWKDKKTSLFPKLKFLSTAFLALASSQADVERTFSSLAFILSPLRTKLTAEHLQQIILLRENAWFVVSFM